VQIHGGNITEIGRRYNLKEDTIIDFSSNINPLGFPRGVKTLLQKEGHNIVRYPDPDSSELKRVISRMLDVDEKTILVGNGSTELIHLIPRVFKPKCALIPAPTFSEYEKSLFSLDCKLGYIHLREKELFSLNINEMINLLPKINILYLCNPNNPTGVLLPKSKIKPLLVKADRVNVLVVIDEAFMDFTDRQSITSEASRRKNLIVIKSMTKFFGIPGLRLGYLIANPKIVGAMNRYKEPWTVNTLAQKAGIACFKDRNFLSRTKEFIDQERKHFFTQLQKIKGLKPFNSSTNYILIKLISKRLPSDKLYEKMARRGFLIRDCRSFRGLGNKFIRVAVKKRKENNLLIKNLKELLEN
jgi:threonine-phosphate decarboxylase